MKLVLWGMMVGMKKLAFILALIFVSPIVLLFLFVGASLWEMQSSALERVYQDKMEKIIFSYAPESKKGKSYFKLQEVVPFEWVAACYIHGYPLDDENEARVIEVLGDVNLKGKGNFFDNGDTERFYIKTVERKIIRIMPIWNRFWPEPDVDFDLPFPCFTPDDELKGEIWYIEER